MTCSHRAVFIVIPAITVAQKDSRAQRGAAAQEFSIKG